MAETYRFALVGNPNVGKSSLFNALTGLHQHTGNWPGKTVATAAAMSWPMCCGLRTRRTSNLPSCRSICLGSSRSTPPMEVELPTMPKMNSPERTSPSASTVTA